MIIFLPGADIFQMATGNEPVEAIVNAVNTRGIMGGGIAADFRKRYPDMYLSYVDACAHGMCAIGINYVWKNAGHSPKYIINFPTKDHWRNPSRIEFIELGAKDLLRIIINLNIKSIAIPMLGCGLGGLDWPLVRSVLEDILGGAASQIYLLGEKL